MTIATRELRASFAFVERNFNLTKRYWGWEVAWLVYSLAAALAVAFIGVAQDDPELLQVLIIGAIFWNFLSIVFGFIGETVTWERWEGTLEYTFMAPVRRYTQLIGSTFFAVAYAVIQMVIILVVMLLFFDVRFTGGNWVTAGGLPGARVGQLRRRRDDGGHPAAALRGARRPDGVRHPVDHPAVQRRVLHGRDPPRVDAVRRAVLAGHVRARRDPRRPDRRQAGDRRCSTTSGRW